MTTARKTAKKAAKKTPAKKASKTAAAKKTTTKKATTKKAATKKATTKKATTKKAATKKAATKKATPKKSSKKSARKVAAQSTASKKSSKKAAQHAAQQPSAGKKSSKKAAQHAARKTAAAQPTPVKPARVAAPPEPRMGPKYAVLKADYRRQPGADDINRVGGLPIGFDAASWPRREGVPMYHVLTIDLKDHPAIVARRFRALALFISSPMKHEAYTPGNDHTAVILLTEDDLQKGVPAWPDELDKQEGLRAGRLRFESAAELTREKLYQESFAGDDPIWLQGDESDEDYADYGDDDDDDDTGDDDDGDDDGDDDSDDTAADPRQHIPHIFVLQFDERLIRGINLGDAGIMYVFSDSAWFQCH